MAMAPTSVSSDAASATTFARTPANSTAAEATSGISARTVTQGNPVEEVISAHPHQEQRRGDREGADEHRQGVRPGEPGLRTPQARAGATDQRRQAVDATVDAAAVEEHQRPGEVGPRPHEDVLVDGVAVERPPRRPGHRGDVERLLDRYRLTRDEPPCSRDAARHDEQ